MNAVEMVTLAETEDRLRKSLQALAAWRWEARLPWANRALTRSVIETEISALGALRDRAPADRKAAVSEMIRQYRTFLAEHL